MKIKNNPFTAYQKAMIKTGTYFIECDIQWYYIYNPYMLLRITRETYITYFQTQNENQFPFVDNWEQTICFNKNRKNKSFDITYTEKINIAKTIPANNSYTAYKTAITINTGKYNCNVYAVTRAENPYCITINTDFIKPIEKIFSNDCIIAAGEKENKPLLFIDNLNDTLAFVLPVRYEKLQNVKSGIIADYS